MSFLNPKLGIDFSAYIVDRTLNFTGREWVFEAIQNWLADPKGDRFFLITGEPGSGKTAIAARLTQFAQGAETYLGFEKSFLHAVHFCSARDSVWTDPKEFARSLALQLAQSIPKFGLALKDIRESNNININVVQTFDTVQNSSVEGVFIQNLTISGLTGQEAFTQVVVNPLRQIQQEGFSQPVMILVDSLDEALTHDGGNTIVDLLSKLSSSVKLRLIVTSRDEARVRNVIKGAKKLFLSDPQDPESLQQNRKDVRTYAETRLTKDQDLVVQLGSWAHSQQNEYIETITDKSDGNFLYIRFLLDAIASGQRSITDLEGLPQGLDELYYESLERVVKLGKKDWSEAYAPIMGVLLAAQESLSLKQLTTFTGQGDTVISGCLNNLRQFLDKIELEEDEYRIYHQSVADFLGKRSLSMDGKTSENLYYLSMQEQHELLLEYYRPKSKSWDDVSLETIDTYGLRHLANHLVQAGQSADLHNLLALSTPNGRNAWFEQREKVGDISGFLDDIQLAWVIADKEFSRDSETSVRLQCRYAMMVSSVKSLAKNIPTALVMMLVRKEVWTSKQGLAYACQVDDMKQKARILIGLAPDLSGENNEFALQVALTIHDGTIRRDVLTGLATNLSESLVQQALVKTRTLDNEYERGKTIAALGEKLRSTLNGRVILESEITATLSMTKSYRKDILADLAPYLSEPLLEESMHLGEESRSFDSRIIPHLSETLAVKALDITEKTNDEESKGQGVIQLAPHLPDSLLAKALEIAKQLENKDVKNRVLLALIPRLSQPILLEVLEEILSLVQETENDDEKRAALTKLASYLPESLLKKALEILQSLKDEKQKVDALVTLTPFIPKPLLAEMLNTTKSFVDRAARQQGIEAVALRLAALGEPQKALSIVMGAVTDEIIPRRFVWDYKGWKGEVIAKLAPNLPTELLLQALTAAQKLRTSFEKSRSLTDLVPYLPYSLRKRVIEKVLKTASLYGRGLGISIVGDLRDTLPKLAPYLSDEALRQKALSSAQSLDGWWQVRALVRFADCFPEPSREKALRAALNIARNSENDLNFRSYVLDLIAPYLSQPLLCEALLISQTIESQFWQITALTALCPYLPKPNQENVLLDLLSQTRTLQLAEEQAEALAALSHYLPKRLKLAVAKEALTIAQNIKDNRSHRRTFALLKLIRILPPDTYDWRYALLKLSFKLGSLQMIALQKVLAIANSERFGSNDSKVRAYISLAPYLSEPLLLKTITAARQIKDLPDRSEALIQLLPWLSPSLKLEILHEAFSLVTGIENVVEEKKARLLANLAPHLTSSLLQKAMKLSEAINATFLRRYQTLEKLAIRLTELNSCEKVSENVNLDPNLQVSLRHKDLREAALKIIKAEADNLPSWDESQLSASIKAKRRGFLAIGNWDLEQLEDIEGKGRTRKLSELMPNLLALPLNEKYGVWREILLIASQRNREELLKDFTALAPLTASISSQEAIQRIVGEIKSVVGWWP